MASFSVNESLFVLDLDDTAPSLLPVGEVLPDGIKIGVDRDRGEEFAFYVSEDGKFDILAARPVLAERWVREGYLEKRALQIHLDQNDEIDCYLLISPSSHVLSRLTDVRVYSSSYYAHLVASTMWGTRHKDPFVNMRDGILCELYGLVLPTYTKTPQIADVCLFNNTLRGQYDSEELSLASEFGDGSGGINRMTFNEGMKKFGMKPDTIEPYFQVGEFVDDFVQMAPHAAITGPLELRREFQIFATDTDVLLLALSQGWAEELIERNLILSMDLKTVQLGRELVRIMPLPRRYALECLDNRHHGICLEEIFPLALALHRTRTKLPEAVLKDALYVQALGLILPTKFTGGAQHEDVGVIRDAITIGPFAQGAFLDDVLTSAIAVVNAPLI